MFQSNKFNISIFYFSRSTPPPPICAALGIAIWWEELDLAVLLILGFRIDWAAFTATFRRVVQIASRERNRYSEEIHSCFLELTMALFNPFRAGADAGRSVPERADEHVRAEHGEGLRVGHHEAM